MEEKTCKHHTCYQKTRKTPMIKNNRKIEKIELVVFDMDGVLADTLSSWKHVHDYFNTSNEESVEKYLQGEIDDLEFIKRDVSLWKINNKPIKKEKLEKILKNIPIMKGAKETTSFLKKHGIKTAIISAGLDILAERIAKELSIDYVFANGVKTDEKGFLTTNGILKVQLKHKEKTVLKLSKQLNIPLNNIVTIGNSCFDTPMFQVTGLSIAFNPEDKCVRDAADYIVEEKNLLKTLDIIKKHI